MKCYCYDVVMICVEKSEDMGKVKIEGKVLADLVAAGEAVECEGQGI